MSNLLTLSYVAGRDAQEGDRQLELKRPHLLNSSDVVYSSNGSSTLGIKYKVPYTGPTKPVVIEEVKEVYCESEDRDGAKSN